MDPDLNSRGLPSTHWSEIASASQTRQEQGRETLNRLLTRYQAALLAHLRFKFRVGEDAAQDLLQSFVADKILEKKLLSQANPARGRFRTFLLKSLDNFVVSQRRKERAQKRSPGSGVLSVDELSAADEPQHNDPPIDRTEIVWAQAALDSALLNMRRECETSSRMDIWGVFEGRLLSAVLKDSPETGYEKLIQRFGFKSPSHAFNVLNTAKRMFKRHLRSVIAEYARDSSEIEEELGELKGRLLRAG